MSGVANLRPATPGNDLAVTHGARASIGHLSPRADELAGLIRPLVPNRQPHHDLLVTLLARNLTRQERAEKHIDEHGLFDRKGKPQAVLTHLNTWAAESRRLIASLGMDNVRGGQLAAGFDLAKYLAELASHAGTATEEGSADEQD